MVRGLLSSQLPFINASIRSPEFRLFGLSRIFREQTPNQWRLNDIPPVLYALHSVGVKSEYNNARRAFFSTS